MANPIEPASVDPSVGSIVKSDRTGRTRYTAQYKQEALDAFESSSLSAPAFARNCVSVRALASGRFPGTGT